MRYSIEKTKDRFTNYTFCSGSESFVVSREDVGASDTKRIARRLLPIVEAAIKAIKADDDQALGVALGLSEKAFPGEHFKALFATAISLTAVRCVLLLLQSGYAPDENCSVSWKGVGDLSNAPPLILLAYQFQFMPRCDKSGIAKMANALCEYGAEPDKLNMVMVNRAPMISDARTLLEKSGLWAAMTAGAEADVLRQATQTSSQQRPNDSPEAVGGERKVSMRI